MIPKAVREAVWERAGGLCEKCRTKGDWRGLQFAHKIHRKMGGRKGKMKEIIDHEDNLLLLCAHHHDLMDGRIKEET